MPLINLCRCHKAVEDENQKDGEKKKASCFSRHRQRIQQIFSRGTEQEVKENKDDTDDTKPIDSEIPQKQEASSALSTKKQESGFYLLNLPEIIIIKIASYLPKDETFLNLAVTCKDVCILLMHRILWLQPYLAQHRSIIPITNTRPPRGCLRALDLTDCVQATDRYIYFIVQLHPQIHELTVAGCKKLTDKSVRMVMRFLKGLTKFDMSDTCHISSRAVSEFCAHFNDSLEYLDLSHSVGTLKDRYQLRGIKWKMAQLSTFKCNWDKYLDWCSVGGVWIIMEFLRNCPNLTVVELGGYDMLSTDVTDLSYSLPCIKKLSIHKCIMRSMEITGVFSAMPNKLTHLDMSGCSYSVSEEELFVIAKTQRSLKALDLSHCYNVDCGMVRMVMENLLELTEFKLQSCHKIGDIAMDIIMKHPKLAFVDVSDTCVTLTHLQFLLRNHPPTSQLIVVTNGCARNQPLRHDFWETVPKIEDLQDENTMESLLHDFQSQPQFPLWSKVY